MWGPPAEELSGSLFRVLDLGICVLSTPQICFIYLLEDKKKLWFLRLELKVKCEVVENWSLMRGFGGGVIDTRLSSKARWWSNSSVLSFALQGTHFDFFVFSFCKLLCFWFLNLFGNCSFFLEREPKKEKKKKERYASDSEQWIAYVSLQAKFWLTCTFCVQIWFEGMTYYG